MTIAQGGAAPRKTLRQMMPSEIGFNDISGAVQKFRCTVTIYSNGQRRHAGEGGTKKQAKTAAALQALLIEHPTVAQSSPGINEAAA